MEKVPEEITVCVLQCLLMPQGEIICCGKTIGWFKDFGKYLQPLEQRNELLETCKLGVKFIGSLPRTISQTQQENKDGFLEILEQAINKAQGL